MFFSIQNLPRYKSFYSKSVFQVVFFQILAALLSKCYQPQGINCWKMTTAWVEKMFYECAACVCLTFGTIFLVIALFMAIRFLMGVMTISFALAIELYNSLWISKKD